MAVRFVLPPSTALSSTRADAVAWARHRMIGGRLARAWGAYTLGGSQYCWTIRHGSGCDPTADVDAVATASLATVVLTPGTDYTSQQVADAVAAQLLSSFGHVASVDSATVDGVTRYRVTVPFASSGIVGGAAIDGGRSGTAGIQQARRDGAGAVNGTVWVHTEVHARNRDGTEVADGTRARIIGVKYYGVSGFRGRCAVGLGGAYANPPGAITGIVDAGRAATGSANGYEPIVLPLPTAIPCVIGDDAWIGVCDNGGSGSLGYIFHGGGAPFGDLVDGDDLLVEGSRNDPTAAFPSSASPTITASFGVTSLVGLVVEVDDPAIGDGSGFPGDGSIYVEFGCQRDAAGETPTSAVPNGLGAGETFHLRMLVPELERVAMTGAAFALGVVDASEDATTAVYSWADLANPPGSAPTLLADNGLAGFDTATPNAYTETTFPAPVPIGSDAVADPYVSLGFGFGVITGGIPAASQILFDSAGAVNGPDGERLYDQGASPDLLPSDWVVGGLRAGVEFVSLPTSTMPYDGSAQAWPDPYDLAGTDLMPGNLGRGYAIIRELSPTADVVTVSDVADASSSTAFPLATCLCSD